MLRVIVLIPTRGSVAVELLSALMNNTEGYDIVLRTASRLSVDFARNQLAEMAIAAADDLSLFSRDEDPFVFWIDSDAFFVKGTFSLMLDAFTKNPSIALLAALFGPRAANRGATAFRKHQDRASFLMPDVDVCRGDVVDVELVGMHLVLHRVSLLRAVGVNPFGVEGDHISDDAAFCGRIRMLDGRIAVATGIPAFHVDERNGAAYSPGIAACLIDGDGINTHVLATELPAETRSYGKRIDDAVK